MKIEYIQMRVDKGTDTGTAAKEAVAMCVFYESNVKYEFNGSMYQVRYNDLLSQVKLP